MIKPNRKTYWVVNPTCGNGAGRRRWAALERQLLDKGMSIQAALTRGPGHATEICRAALFEGYDHIIVAGGDGTINEVINGFYQNNTSERINPKAVFSAVALGSGCDFTRMLGSTNRLEAILSICQGGKEIGCDLVKASYYNWAGQDENRYFVNAADIGLGCEIARRVNQQGKRLGGFLSFLITTLKTLAKAECKNISLYVDGQEVFTGPANLVAVANGQYFGGGMRIAPSAQIDDGYLDIIVLHNLSRSEILVNLPRVYTGSHLSHPKVSFHRGQQAVIISEEEINLEMDGETPGTGNCRFQILKSELRIVVPDIR